MRDTLPEFDQWKINKWFDEVIRPNTTAQGTFKKFLGEVNELADAYERADMQHIEEESADVLISLFAWLHMMGIPVEMAVARKMTVNRQRKWGPPDERGVIQHIEGT